MVRPTTNRFPIVLYSGEEASVYKPTTIRFCKRVALRQKLLYLRTSLGSLVFLNFSSVKRLTAFSQNLVCFMYKLLIH